MESIMPLFVYAAVAYNHFGAEILDLANMTT
jgi:hypothetical protein